MPKSISLSPSIVWFHPPAVCWGNHLRAPHVGHEHFRESPGWWHTPRSDPHGRWREGKPLLKCGIHQSVCQAAIIIVTTTWPGFFTHPLPHSTCLPSHKSTPFIPFPSYACLLWKLVTQNLLVDITMLRYRELGMDTQAHVVSASGEICYVETNPPRRISQTSALD